MREQSPARPPPRTPDRASAQVPARASAGSPSRSRIPTSWRYALTTLLFSGLLTVAATAWQVYANREALERRSNSLARDVVAQVQARMRAYEYGLRGARGAIVSAGPERVSRQDFRRYALTRDIAHEFPGARGFGFIRKLSQADEASFLAAARRDGAPAFKIQQVSPHPGERFVIQYIEPEAPNAPALGLDIASEPKRREAALRSLREARAVLTAPITLVQATGKPMQSFLLLLPIYRDPIPPDAVAAREASGLGWAYVPLSADEILADLPGERRDYLLTLRDVDGGATATAPPFFTSRGEESQAADGSGTRLPLTVFGRQWEAQIQPTRAFVLAAQLRSPTEVALEAGFVATLLTVLAWIYGQSVTKRRAQQQERERRAAMVESSVDAFIGVSLDGRITSWNAAAQAMFGYSDDEAIGQLVDELLLPQSRRHEVEPMLERIRQGLPVLTYETTRMTRTGHELDVAISLAPLRDAQGHIVGMAKTLRDISTAKAAERELKLLTAGLERQIEERTASLDAAHRDLHNILDALPSMVGYWDRELRNRFANRAYRDWFCKREGQLAGKTMQEVLGPELFNQLRPNVDAALRGEPQTFERCQPSADGRAERHLLAHYIPDLVDGEVRGFYVLIHDITELKQAGAELKATHERLTLATQASRMGIWDYDIAAGELDCDARMYSIYGRVMSGQRPSFSSWVDQVAPEERASVEKRLYDCIEGHTDFNIDFSIVRLDGERRRIRAAAKVYRDAQGVAQRLIGVNWDVTEPWLAELELRETTSLLRTVLASASEVAIIATDTDYVIRVFNAGAEKLLGYRSEEVVGRATPGLVHDAQEIRTRARELGEELGHHVSAANYFRELRVHGIAREWTYRRKDGSAVPVSLVVTGMYDDAGKLLGYLGIAHDVSEQKRHERALLEAKTAAEQANRAKSQFLANMSHEIRTPMNAVTGLSFLLEQTQLDSQQRDLLSKMSRASRTLLEVITDVLDLSKIEAGELGISPEPFSPAELLKDLIDVMQVQATQKGIRLELVTPQPLPALVTGDATRVNQIISNLLSNAIKFTTEGGVRLLGLIKPAPAAHTLLRFEVHDTGIGIAPQAWAHLFQPFTQADGSITRRFGGTGLGLSIVKQLAELMGGEVGFSSVPGKGSMFWVEIPFPLASPRWSPATEPAARPNSVALSDINILVVDDSDINLEVAKQILEATGAHVSLATNGLEAVEHLRQHGGDCDLVLMDIHMPHMDGITATRLIRQELGLQSLPIVALTAGALASQRQDARQAGMDDFIVKPFSPDSLIACIARLVPRLDAAVPDLATHEELDLRDWPAIEGIDREDAARRLRGDAGLFRALLELLLREFPDLPNPGRGDFPLQALATMLHKLRGSAGTLGAREIQATAARAEQACLRGDGAEAAMDIESLNRLLRELSEAAAPWLSQARPASRTTDATSGPQSLDELRRLLNQQHAGALDAFEHQASSLLQSLGEARFGVLRDHIEHLRFAAALATLDGEA